MIQPTVAHQKLNVFKETKMLTQRRAAQGQKCSARFTTEILNKKPELHILDYKIEKLT